MKVIRIIKRLPPLPGGMEQHALRLSVEHAQLGLNTVLLCRAGTPPSLPGLSGILISVRPKPLRPEILDDWIFMRAISRDLTLQNSRPHIVHTHGGAMLCALGANLAHRIGSIHCHSIHGVFPTKFPREQLWGWALQKTDHVFCVSQMIASDVNAIGIRNTSVRSSGYDPTLFYPSPNSSHAGPPWRVITVGRLHPVKGLEVLFKACNLLSQRGVPIHLEIVGDGPLRSQHENAVKREGLSATFHGNLQSAEVGKLLRQSHIFVQPSVTLLRQAEGTPTSIIEAMASGIPVISTTSGGTRALISDRITGLLVEEQSPSAITTAIEMMIADEGLRARISQAALIAVAHHTWAHVGREILMKYQALTGASR